MGGVASVCRPTIWAGPRPSRKSLNWLSGPRRVVGKTNLKKNNRDYDRLSDNHGWTDVEITARTHTFLRSCWSWCCHRWSLCCPAASPGSSSPLLCQSLCSFGLYSGASSFRHLEEKKKNPYTHASQTKWEYVIIELYFLPFQNQILSTEEEFKFTLRTAVSALFVLKQAHSGEEPILPNILWDVPALLKRVLSTFQIILHSILNTRTGHLAAALATEGNKFSSGKRFSQIVPLATKHNTQRLGWVA